MYLVEQQERLAASATKPISWGRHGYCEVEKDATLRLRSTAKGISQKLGVNASAGEGMEKELMSLSTFPLTISPSLNLSIRSLFMMLGAPTLTTLFVYSCDKYQCALTPGIQDLLASAEGIHGVYDLLVWALSPLRWFTWKALAIYMLWYIVQAIMYAVVPSKIGYGQKTLAGRQLPYKVWCLFLNIFEAVSKFVNKFQIHGHAPLSILEVALLTLGIMHRSLTASLVTLSRISYSFRQFILTLFRSP